MGFMDQIVNTNVVGHARFRVNVTISQGFVKTAVNLVGRDLNVLEVSISNI